MKKILKNKKILFLSLGAAVVGASVVAIAASCAAAGHSASSVQYKQNKLAITLAEKVEKAVGDELAKEKFTVTVVKTKEDGSQESVVIANSAGSYLAEVNMVVVDATPNTSIAEGDRVIVSSKSVKATFTVDKQFAGKYEAASSSSTTPAPTQEAVVVSTVSVDVTNADPVVTLTFAADIPANMEVKLKVAKKDGTNEKEMPATVSTTNKKQATVTLSGLEAATEYKVTVVMVATKTATLPTTGLNFTTKAAAATPAPNTGSDTSGSASGSAGSSGATTGGSDNTSGSSTPATGTGV